MIPIGIRFMGRNLGELLELKVKCRRRLEFLEENRERISKNVYEKLTQEYKSYLEAVDGEVSLSLVDYDVKLAEIRLYSNQLGLLKKSYAEKLQEIELRGVLGEYTREQCNRLCEEHKARMQRFEASINKYRGEEQKLKIFLEQITEAGLAISRRPAEIIEKESEEQMPPAGISGEEIKPAEIPETRGAEEIPEEIFAGDEGEGEHELEGLVSETHPPAAASEVRPEEEVASAKEIDLVLPETAGVKESGPLGDFPAEPLRSSLSSAGLSPPTSKNLALDEAASILPEEAPESKPSVPVETQSEREEKRVPPAGKVEFSFEEVLGENEKEEGSGREEDLAGLMLTERGPENAEESARPLNETAPGEEITEVLDLEAVEKARQEAALAEAARKQVEDENKSAAEQTRTGDAGLEMRLESEKAAETPVIETQGVPPEYLPEDKDQVAESTSVPIEDLMKSAAEEAHAEVKPADEMFSLESLSGAGIEETAGKKESPATVSESLDLEAIMRESGAAEPEREGKNEKPDSLAEKAAAIEPRFEEPIHEAPEIVRDSERADEDESGEIQLTYESLPGREEPEEKGQKPFEETQELKAEVEVEISPVQAAGKDRGITLERAVSLDEKIELSLDLDRSDGDNRKMLTVDQTIDAIKKKTVKCPVCGTMNYAIRWYCEKCEATLTSL